MTQPNPADPGDPAVTDEEYTGPDLAETTPEEDAVIDATEAADAAAGNAGGAGDEVLDAEVEDALAEDPATATEATAAADAAADAADEAVAEAEAAPEASPLEVELAERTADLQRMSAEYANYRKRTERDRGRSVRARRPTPSPDCCRSGMTWTWPSSTVTSPGS